MRSEITPWWDSRKIMWYNRAASHSNFHKTLSDELSKLIDIKESIIESGCGLGYISEELYKRGYKITAYDSDKTAIESARERSGLDIYSIADCFNLQLSADTLLTVFFGKITDEDNFDRLTRNIKKQFLYVTGGGAARHTTTANIEDFLKSRSIPFNKTKAIIPFHQPLKDETEAEDFLDTYYKGELKEIKRRSLKNCNDTLYSLLLENNKEITIFDIKTGGSK